MDTMKHLLRKIFFWDAPAQGAMFGLTLLLAAVWFAFSLLCCVGVVHYPLLLGISLGIAFGVAALVLLGYIAFLLGRIPLLISLKTTGFWRRLWVPLVLFVLSLGYGAAVGFLDEMYWKWGMFSDDTFIYLQQTGYACDFDEISQKFFTREFILKIKE